MSATLRSGTGHNSKQASKSSSMASAISLPYDIIGHIIDILAEEGDLVLLNNPSLASSSLLHLCRRHIFRTIPFDNFYFKRQTPPKHSFIRLLDTNPGIVQYIRELNYEVHHNDAQLSPRLPNLLQTISHLRCLRIRNALLENPAQKFDWTKMDPLLRSALLRLMHLPTLTHFEISMVHKLPLSALVPCINLEGLDIQYSTVLPFEESDLNLKPEIRCLQTPRILHFTTNSSTCAVGMLLGARWKDGRLLLDFTHLKTLYIDFTMFEDADVTRNLFKCLEQLEELSVNGILFLTCLE